MNKNIKVSVVGCVKDCEKNLEYNYFKIKNTLKNVELNWFLVESDSNDQTIPILKKIAAQDSNFEYISLGKLFNKYKNRIKRLTHCRERYLTEIKNNKNKYNFYIMIMDLDEKMDLFTFKGFKSCFNRKYKWSACSATQKKYYYDLYALRHNNILPNDCIDNLKNLDKKNFNYIQNIYQSIYSKMIEIGNINYWLEVDSAFGGTTIYKKKDLINLSYFSNNNKNFKHSEHVSINLHLKNLKKKIFINPKFKNFSSTHHDNNWELRYIKFWYYKLLIKSFIKRINLF